VARVPCVGHRSAHVRRMHGPFPVPRALSEHPGSGNRYRRGTAGGRASGPPALRLPGVHAQSRRPALPTQDRSRADSRRDWSPVIPVGMVGTDVVQPRGRVMPTLARVEVRLGATIPPPTPAATDQQRAAQVRELTEQVIASLAALTGQLGAEVDAAEHKYQLCSPLIRRRTAGRYGTEANSPATSRAPDAPAGCRCPTRPTGSWLRRADLAVRASSTLYAVKTRAYPAGSSAVDMIAVTIVGLLALTRTATPISWASCRNSGCDIASRSSWV
jgi:hypothetical protein